MMKKTNKETKKKDNGELLNKHGLKGADGVLKAFLSSLPGKFGFGENLVVTVHVLETQLGLCEACLDSGDQNNFARKAKVGIFKNEKTGKVYVIGEIFLGRFGWRHLRRGDDNKRIYFKNIKSLKRFLTDGADDLLKEFYDGKAQASPNNTKNNKKKIRNKIIFSNS